jgi:hypothetical protein
MIVKLSKKRKEINDRRRKTTGAAVWRINLHFNENF